MSSPKGLGSAPRRFIEGADVCIVGAGPAGGIVALELARAGLDVVILEAGPFWVPEDDFASDELHMDKLGWQQTRIVAGSDPLTMGINNSGWGVGGGTTHFTAVFPRFHSADFSLRSDHGVGEDWPLSYGDLAAHYDAIEKDIAVSGPAHFPWGDFRGPYPYPVREPISSNSELFRRGCETLGIVSEVSPLAILSAPFDGRPPCTNRGFCNQGCIPRAKYSAGVHHVPKAIAAGAELLDNCTVTRLGTGPNGAVSEAVFSRAGREGRQRARLFVLANFTVEAPRLLLASRSAEHPAGLANSSGTVGQYIMAHSSDDCYAVFGADIRLYKGPPVMAISEDFYETDASRGFVGGYTLAAHGRRPVEFAKDLAEGGLWGDAFRRAVLEYNHYGSVSMTGHVLPQRANSVSLVEGERDDLGVPLAKVTFSYSDNDRKVISHAMGKAAEILRAAGGQVTMTVPDTAHLMGGCRMGNDPTTSVTDSFGQTHDIPNLFITGAPLFVTSGSTNPTATVMALARRTALRIPSELR